MTKPGVVTSKKSELRAPWREGQSGNPAGHPKGSRVKLSEAFVADLLESWQQRGQDVIARVIHEKPEALLKVVASLMTKDLNVNVSPLVDLTDEQLIERIRKLDESTGPFLSQIRRRVQ